MNYRAFMRLFTRVSSHVHYQHVLSFEWLFISRTSLPSTHKRLLVAVNVIGVDVSNEFVLGKKFESAASPVTVCFEENTAVVFGVGCVGENCFAARAAVVITRSKITIIIFGTENVFISAISAEAILLVSAMKVTRIGTLMMVDVRTCRRQLSVLNDVVTAVVVVGTLRLKFYFHLSHVLRLRRTISFG
jgi:hypothetical protein